MDNRDNAERRPSPEALLRQARQVEQGRLKIFFGAAPGVGKTYEMLTTARAKKAEGTDVVAGIVETHGRKETEALLQGLEIVPRRTISYRDHAFSEMDLDAILARRPRLVLVDELAQNARRRPCERGRARQDRANIAPRATAWGDSDFHSWAG
jgi:two-component system sensor histidine kinase KdpD